MFITSIAAACSPGVSARPSLLKSASTGSDRGSATTTPRTGPSKTIGVSLAGAGMIRRRPAAGLRVARREEAGEEAPLEIFVIGGYLGLRQAGLRLAETDGWPLAWW